jgi:hypothetical protein
VLACRNSLAGDLGVDGGNGEIHDDLDVWMCQDVVTGAPLGDVVLLGLSLRPVLVEVTQDHYPYVGEAGEVLEIGVADHPRTDEADTDGPGC